MAAKRKRKLVSGPWSAEEVKLLKRIFRNTSTAEVAAQLNRSVGSVQGKARTLGLTKTKKYLKSLGRA